MRATSRHYGVGQIRQGSSCAARESLPRLTGLLFRHAGALPLCRQAFLVFPFLPEAFLLLLKTLALLGQKLGFLLKLFRCPVFRLLPFLLQPQTFGLPPTVLGVDRQYSPRFLFLAPPLVLLLQSAPPSGRL